VACTAGSAFLTLHLVHNDFHVEGGIFPIFEGLEVKDLDKPLHSANIDLPTANGTNGTNGTHGTNGTNGSTKEINGEEDQNHGLLAAAKAAVADVTNGIKGLAVSH
jgi:methylenetetrahydrofolate reductase (NADPH)